MGNCQIARYENDKKVSYSCDDIKRLFPIWKEEFRKNNKSDETRRDIYFDRFCKEMEEIINNCKCINNTCDKCSLEDHEGSFCRCESRNIELAKKLRIERKITK